MVLSSKYGENEISPTYMILIHVGKPKSVHIVIIKINKTIQNSKCIIFQHSPPAWSSTAQTFVCFQKKMFSTRWQATYALLPSAHGHWQNNFSEGSNGTRSGLCGGWGQELLWNNTMLLRVVLGIHSKLLASSCHALFIVTPHS